MGVHKYSKDNKKLLNITISIFIITVSIYNLKNFQQKLPPLRMCLTVTTKIMGTYIH